MTDAATDEWGMSKCSFPDIRTVDVEPPVEVNAAGGKQHFIGVAMDEIPARAILGVGRVLYQGMKKYGRGNWRALDPREDQVNHAINHLYLWLSGDRDEDHLTNAICRTLFAKEQELEEEDSEQPVAT